MSFPKLVCLSGSSKERGLQYGIQCSEEISRNIEFYQKMFSDYGINWEQAKSIALKFISPIKTYYPHALEEMDGIAQGSSFSFEDILTLNCRSEILFARPDGCSSVGVLPELSENGHTLLGQTWDWLKPAYDKTVILKGEESDGTKTLSCVEAGILGGKGLNSHGIGVCLNALSTGRGKIGVPLHLIYRKILQQNSISNALDAIAQADRAGCGNFALGSKEGFLMCVEYTSDNFDVIMPVNEVMCHTNHYQSCWLAPQDVFKGQLTDTFVRLNRMKRFFLNKKKVSQDDIWSILSDHANFPDSVCSHEDPADPEGKRLCTVYAILMDLNEQKLRFSEGNPCSGRIKEYSL